jgi:HemY protein
MIKKGFYILAGGLFTSIVVMLLDNPGSIQIEWFEYQITSSMAAVILLLSASTISLVMIVRIIRVIAYRFLSSLGYGKNDKFKMALQELSMGFVAALVGDRKMAHRIVRDVEASIGHHPMINILKIQNEKTITLDEDSEGLNKDLLRDSETKTLGVLRLAQTAARSKNYKKAIELLTENQETMCQNTLILENIIDIHMKLGDWDEAIKVLEAAMTQKGNSRLANSNVLEKLYYFAAKHKLTENQPKAAEKFARASLLANDKQCAIRTLLVYALINQNQIDKAEKIIIQAWELRPTTELIEAYKKLEPQETHTAFAARIDKLASANSDHPLSRLVKSKAYLNAGLYGQVGNQLETIQNEGLDPEYKIPLLALIIKHHANAGNKADLDENINALIMETENQAKKDTAAPKAFSKLESLNIEL